MENLMNLRWWSACIGVLVGEFLGDFDHLLYALVVFIAVDYITGVLCAVLDKNLSSEIGFQGIVRKVAIFLLVGVANVLDVHIIGRLPVPKKLQEAMKEIREKQMLG